MCADDARSLEVLSPKVWQFDEKLFQLSQVKQGFRYVKFI